VLIKKMFELCGGVFTAIIGLKLLNACGELFFNKELKFHKMVKHFTFITKRIQPCEPTKIINENYIKPTSTH
jgi:hypothetical protein